MIIYINMLTNLYGNYCSIEKDHFLIIFCTLKNREYNKNFMSFYVELKK